LSIATIVLWSWHDAPMNKAPRLLVAAVVVAGLLWLRLFYSFVSNAPPPKRFVYFDDKGQVVESPLCSGPLVADGPRVWAVCARSGTQHIGRFDVDAGRVDLSAPIAAGRDLQGFFRAGDDAYLMLSAGSVHQVYRAHPDGRVDDLGAIHDGAALRGFALVNDHVEVVIGFTSPAIYAPQGSEWKRRPIAYRDGEYRSRSFELAYREAGGWKFVVAHFPATSPPDAPLNVDVELGDESGKWETTQQIVVPARFAYRAKDGTLEPNVRTLIDPSAGNVIALLVDSELPYAFRNGRFEANRAPAEMPGFWRSNASWQDQRLVSVPSSSRGNSMMTMVRERWLTASTDGAVSLQELASGKQSPHAIVPSAEVFDLLPQPKGYVLLSAYHKGAYARVDEDLRRSDPPNPFLRLRLLDAPWWQKLILAVMLLSPIGLFFGRRWRRIEPVCLGYLLFAVVAAIWLLPVLSRV
jgi:hypothetical protein